MSETLYKVLNPNGAAVYANGFVWPLPNGKPTKWVRAKGELILCQNGIHLCRPSDLIHWLGPEIYVAEARGGRLEDDQKVAVREARLVQRVETWNEKTARLFAADCAERVLPIFEKDSPKDDRPRKAIEAARAFARGEIDDAARTAAWDAAWDAAKDAAWDAAWAAARGAAEGAEREWQTERLFQYLNGEIK